MQTLKEIRQQVLCFRRMDQDAKLKDCRQNASVPVQNLSWNNHTDVTLFDEACWVMQVVHRRISVCLQFGL
jgi:hypothetical protein